MFPIFSWDLGVGWQCSKRQQKGPRNTASHPAGHRQWWGAEPGELNRTVRLQPRPKAQRRGCFPDLRVMRLKIYVVSLWQLLKGVTIAAGGVLPNIHPELLAKKRGAKGKLETPVSPAPEKKPKTVKKTAAKKLGGKKAGGKTKVWPHV